MSGSVFKTMVCTTFLFPYGMLPCVEKYFLKTIFNLVSACETTVLKVCWNQLVGWIRFLVIFHTLVMLCPSISKFQIKYIYIYIYIYKPMNIHLLKHNLKSKILFKFLNLLKIIFSLLNCKDHI